MENILGRTVVLKILDCFVKLENIIPLSWFTILKSCGDDKFLFKLFINNIEVCQIAATSNFRCFCLFVFLFFKNNLYLPFISSFMFLMGNYWICLSCALLHTEKGICQTGLFRHLFDIHYIFRINISSNACKRGQNGKNSEWPLRIGKRWVCYYLLDRQPERNLLFCLFKYIVLKLEKNVCLYIPSSVPHMNVLKHWKEGRVGWESMVLLNSAHRFLYYFFFYIL